MIKIYKEKILVVLLLFVSLFTIYMCNLSAHAEVENGLAPGEDSAIYNTEWRQANVKYWNQHINFWYMPGFDKTRSYIRITDNKGKFIDNIVRLKACFKIGGEQQLVNKSRTDGNTFTSNNLTSKEGQLSSYSAAAYDNGAKFYSHEKAKKVWSNYEECNYVWSWNYNVEELIYLYVWYLDPTTGKEVAGSFMPDGAHPMYDENGILKGIYDVDGNLLEKFSVGADGIIEDETGKDIVKVDDQKKGEIYDASSIFTTANNALNTTLNYIVLGICILLGLIIILVVLGVIIKICKWIRRE